MIEALRISPSVAETRLARSKRAASGLRNKRRNCNIPAVRCTFPGSLGPMVLKRLRASWLVNPFSEACRLVKSSCCDRDGRGRMVLLPQHSFLFLVTTYHCCLLLIAYLRQITGGSQPHHNTSRSHHAWMVLVIVL